ncbi:LOW QUALITY PROTEIN: hypothetical protein PHMEG_00020136 [Phytophthora megakarya]|uniref:Integrase catalytic domain-containing protein n=1 Tax=Phytophthora megakarya TaxID=4795 RepID=A0A225VR17_9STRA|nr:LOW QUALITY PROTEIN: hypothetical protein PHMEG_00020136 [Phytophthora megakarya]
MVKGGVEVIRTEYERRLWTFNSHNINTGASKKQKVAVKKKVFANFAVIDGVGDIDVWHERLGHTCQEYIRLMVNRGIATGIMVSRRGRLTAQIATQATPNDFQQINDIAFADLLICGVHNGSRFIAVLVVMDGFSRFVKIYILKSKDERAVTQNMQQYIPWAEQQHGKRVAAVVSRQWNIEDTGLVKNC